MNNFMYKRIKMVNYCLDNHILDYMKKRNYYIHQVKLDKIKNRKNNFLPKINSQRNLLKSPKRRPENEKIEQENYKIFRILFSIDYRLPVLSEKKYLSQRYIKELKRERNEINRYQASLITNSKNEINRKLSLSPIKYNKNKDKYELYTDKTGV